MMVKSTARTAVKKVRDVLETKNLEEAKKLLAQAMKVLQSASSKGAIHRKNASRRISRLARRINSLARTGKSPA